MNRHKQQSEKAKELIEKLRLENGKSLDVDEVSRCASAADFDLNLRLNFRMNVRQDFESTHDG